MTDHIYNATANITKINKIIALKNEKEEFIEKYYYLVRNLNFINNFTNVVDDSKRQTSFSYDSCVFGNSCVHKNYSDIHKYINNVENEYFDLYFKTNKKLESLFSLREAHNKFINDFSLFIIVSFISGLIIFILITHFYHLKDVKSNKDRVSNGI